MGQHPMERRSREITRRDFLRRSAATGIALPSMAAILAACGGSANPDTNGGVNSGGVQLARPDQPVVLPLYDGLTAIADAQKPEPGPLKIYNWNDYIYKKVLNKFQDQYGVEIEYTQFTGMSEAISKIQSGAIEFDLFFPTVENLGKLTAAKLIQPLNHTYLPNFQANIWPELQDPFYDQGALPHLENWHRLPRRLDPRSRQPRQPSRHLLGSEVHGQDGRPRRVPRDAGVRDAAPRARGPVQYH